jgi:hypothetical protein
MICPSCGEETPPYQRFYGNCWHRLEETFLMPGREVRKTVTVVFCDPGVTAPEWNREEGTVDGTRI